MKRAYNLKDFSNILPGHGGMVDRFDCTALLSIMAYFFLYSVVMKDYQQTEDALGFISEKLTQSEQANL